MTHATEFALKLLAIFEQGRSNFVLDCHVIRLECDVRVDFDFCRCTRLQCRCLWHWARHLHYHSALFQGNLWATNLCPAQIETGSTSYAWWKASFWPEKSLRMATRRLSIQPQRYQSSQWSRCLLLRSLFAHDGCHLVAHLDHLLGSPTSCD